MMALEHIRRPLASYHILLPSLAMFALQTFTTVLAFLLSFSAQASPLAQRDVVAPPIIKPDSTSIWPVGTQQIVIWDTSSLPPPSQITNPIGQIILGFNESDSLNLNFNNPLAQGFNLTDGNVTITVPDVPPRNDYLIVLFGDSGDTSPSFAITRISPPGSSSTSSASTVPSTVTATSLSITSVTATALMDETPTSTDIVTATLLPTATNPMGTTINATGSSSSSASSTATSALATSSSTSAGWSMHRGRSTWTSATTILMSVAPVMLFII